MTFMLIHIKYRWGTWVYRRGWPGSKGWSRPTGNTCGAWSKWRRTIKEDGKFNSRIKMAKKEKDSRIFWGNEENPKKRMMLRITWLSQQTSKHQQTQQMADENHLIFSGSPSRGATPGWATSFPTSATTLLVTLTTSVHNLFHLVRKKFGWQLT